MSLIEAGDDAIIESAVLRSLKLHLVDVTILVSDSGWCVLVAFREALDDGDHLRTHLF